VQGRNEDVRNLPVDDVERAIADALDRWSRLPDHADAHATAP
jgi:hypothetical protein